MSETVSQIIQFALLKCNVIDESSQPSAEQGTTALTTLNNMLADLAADGVHIGWFPQTDPASAAPLKDQDIGPVKLLLTAELAAHYGIELSPLLIASIERSDRRLRKRAVRYSEADMSELPRAQGPGWRSGSFWG